MQPLNALTLNFPGRRRSVVDNRAFLNEDAEGEDRFRGRVVMRSSTPPVGDPNLSPPPPAFPAGPHHSLTPPPEPQPQPGFSADGREPTGHPPATPQPDSAPPWDWDEDPHGAPSSPVPPSTVNAPPNTPNNPPPHTPLAFPTMPAGPEVRGEPLSPHTGVRRSRYLSAAVLTIVAALGTVAVVNADGESNSTPASSTVIAAPPPAPKKVPSTSASCPSSTEGPTTIGRDKGGTVGGAEVIKAFEYAYYVQRSGAAAREHVAPLGKPGSADQMQDGIAGIDAGTLHCVKVTDRGNGLWALELTEIPPNGGDVIIRHQLVQTIEANGRTFINSIVTDPKAGR